MSLLVGVDDYSSESDVIIIPSALDFVSQDEMLTPLGRLDKYAASENVFNRQSWPFRWIETVTSSTLQASTRPVPNSLKMQ
ncbi:protein phosphatase 4, regulatory subunit 1, isoform CRA_e [Rattus norvegicus]|uniref:Protein phosphatase 4, regulatory subunit 1, isoform CRA_e n=1 Tax=Rattus norvegicus TaxID=10116 RepID=A6JRC5_RAT|nr:protein phosphatase 4, regulatory subunit 1, isoform CRA_e [Rattus norvegicus]